MPGWFLDKLVPQLVSERGLLYVCSLVPRPTCAFHFGAAVGLVPFLMCVTCRYKGGRRVNFCVGKDHCNSQTTKEGSKSVLLVATLWSLSVPQTER